MGWTNYSPVCSALTFTDVCVSCIGGMEWPWSDGRLSECSGVSSVGFYPSGHRIHLAYPHCHLALPLNTLPSCL